MSDDTTTDKAEEKKVDAPEEQKPAEETKKEAPAETEAPAAETSKEETPAPAEATEEKPAEEEVPAEPVSTEMPYKSKLEGMDELTPGLTVRLHERIKDVSPKGESRERIQVFEGMILRMGGSGISRTITLRKVSKGFGVEKIYPINSPLVAKIELLKIAKVRRAKLNYLKDPKRRFKRKLRETYTELGKKKKKK